MDRADYDSKDGIAAQLIDLAGFNAVLKERRAAYHNRKESLNSFVVFGNWLLGANANCSKIETLCPHIGSVVVTQAEFIEASDGQFISSAGSEGPPPDGLLCGGCKEPWRLENCTDVNTRRSDVVVKLEPYVGKTLGDVREEFKQRKDAIYVMAQTYLLRNDRFIDLSSQPEYPALKVNERGWAGKKQGISMEYVIQPGDETQFDVWNYFHAACRAKFNDLRMQEYLKKVFVDAGYGEVTLVAVPNQYCGCENCAPWYTVETPKGNILIGMRKRVMNIDWAATGFDLREDFKKEDVTKDWHTIHAWTREREVFYLKTIRESLARG